MSSILPRVDLSGRVFNDVEVIERAPPVYSPNGHAVQMWVCRCFCGNIFIARHGNITSGTTTSCGCKKRKLTSERFLDDLTGRIFGELTVIERASEIGGNRVKWLCLCSCGRYTIVEGANLKSGNTTSCGCMKNSKAESMIVHILKEKIIKYEKEKKFKKSTF